MKSKVRPPWLAAALACSSPAGGFSAGLSVVTGWFLEQLSKARTSLEAGQTKKPGSSPESDICFSSRVCTKCCPTLSAYEAVCVASQHPELKHHCWAEVSPLKCAWGSNGLILDTDHQFGVQRSELMDRLSDELPACLIWLHLRNDLRQLLDPDFCSQQNYIHFVPVVPPSIHSCCIMHLTLFALGRGSRCELDGGELQAAENSLIR